MATNTLAEVPPDAVNSVARAESTAVGNVYIFAVVRAALVSTRPVSFTVTSIAFVENPCAGNLNSPSAENAIEAKAIVVGVPGSYRIPLSALVTVAAFKNSAAMAAPSPGRVSFANDVPLAAVTRYVEPPISNNGLNASTVGVVRLATVGAVSTVVVDRGVETVTRNVVTTASTSVDVYVNATVAGVPLAPALYVGDAAFDPPPEWIVSALRAGTCSVFPLGFATEIVKAVPTNASTCVFEIVATVGCT